MNKQTETKTADLQQCPDHEPEVIAVPEVAKGDFKDTKKPFGRIHRYLIRKGILNGSSDSIAIDLIDGDGERAVLDAIIQKLTGLPDDSLIEKLVYLALGGIYKLEITFRIRRLLYKHLRDCKEALAKVDYDFMDSIAYEDGLDQTELKKILKSRIRALREVLSLHGDHFLKRAKYVASSFKLKRG